MKKSILILIIIVIILIVAYLLIPKKSIEDDTGYVVKNFDDQIIIELDSNPTTGYVWVVNFDDEYLSLASDTYFPDSTEEDIVGTGGKQIFTFNPVKVGMTELIFDYMREWEEEPIDTQHFKFKIVE